MADMGDVSMVLGTQITGDREATILTISQEHYVGAVSARFGMPECHPVHTTGAEAELSLNQPGLLDSTGIHFNNRLCRGI